MRLPSNLTRKKEQEHGQVWSVCYPFNRNYIDNKLVPPSVIPRRPSQHTFWRLKVLRDLRSNPDDPDGTHQVSDSTFKSFR